MLSSADRELLEADNLRTKVKNHQVQRSGAADPNAHSATLLVPPEKFTHLKPKPATKEGWERTELGEIAETFSMQGQSGGLGKVANSVGYERISECTVDGVRETRRPIVKRTGGSDKALYSYAGECVRWWEESSVIGYSNRAVSKLMYQ